MKYGARDLRDVLERASARESAARVAAGAVCKLLLRECGIEVRSGVLSLGGVDGGAERSFATLQKVREDSPLRAVDAALEAKMVAAVDAAKKRRARRSAARSWSAPAAFPPGLGSFASWDRKLDGRIGQALLSVPGGQGGRVRLGDRGLARTRLAAPTTRSRRGPAGRLRRRTNRAGGLEAGVTNGEDVVAVAYMKPISTLARGLDSVDLETGEPARSAYERSDVTAVSACGVICEAMLAFVLADALLESTGGDRLEDVTARLAAHRERVRGTRES